MTECEVSGRIARMESFINWKIRSTNTRREDNIKMCLNETGRMALVCLGI